MMKAAGWIALPAFVTMASSSALAVQYLSVEQAQQVMFAAGTQFAPLSYELSAAQRGELDAAARVESQREIRVWRATQADKPAGFFAVHEVIGKQEYITYAVAINPQGKVAQVEILDYRESHGYEIRNPRWRQQFAGKSRADAVQLETDIVNISGATLSCRHVTDGVRRILLLHDLVLKSL
jgi:Na+-translocating ferredoxin:NAD+ oxidoreductase RnfG subunit